tara:strand:+ start:137 stop:622 length:486 start_codon:yes stop_codon:yes gene_type:complete
MFNTSSQSAISTDYHNTSKMLIETLQSDPEKHYEYLCDLKNKYDCDFIKKLVDCTYHEAYMGNLLHALICLTGDLVCNDGRKIFGVNSSIHEELGIKILEKLIEYNTNIYFKNYYEETPLQNLKSNGYTKRKNNEKFKKKLEKYYIDDLNIELLLKLKKLN